MKYKVEMWPMNPMGKSILELLMLKPIMKKKRS